MAPTMTAAQFAAKAASLVGLPYVLGAEWTNLATRPKALDCSELVEGLFAINGTPIGDLAASQYDKTIAATGGPRPGDLVFLKNNPARHNGIGHVAVLTAPLSNGDWRIVEARGSKYGVVNTTLSYWKTRKGYTGLRRYPKFALAADPKPTTPATPKTPPLLKVDGQWGDLTSTATAWMLGVTATSLTKALRKAVQKYLSVTQDGIWGPITIKAMQKKVGTTQDGKLGKTTVTAWQKHVNTTIAKATAPVSPSNPATPPAPAHKDTPIILVAGSANTAKDTLHTKYKRRLDVTLKLLQKDTALKVVVTGGVKAGHSKSESSLAKAYLVSQGIAAARILEESKSGSTNGNFTYGLPIAAKAGATSITVISDYSHMRRCLAFCHAANQQLKLNLPIGAVAWFKDSDTQDATVTQATTQAKAAWSGMTETVVKSLDSKWGIK